MKIRPFVLFLNCQTIISRWEKISFLLLFLYHIIICHAAITNRPKNLSTTKLTVEENLQNDFIALD